MFRITHPANHGFTAHGRTPYRAAKITKKSRFLFHTQHLIGIFRTPQQFCRPPLGDNRTPPGCMRPTAGLLL